MREIKKETHSISSLAQKLGIHRSTLRYYLGLLRQENYIEFDRQEKVAGRPILIKTKYKKGGNRKS